MELFHLFDGTHFAGEEIRVGLVETLVEKGFEACGWFGIRCITIC